MAPTDREQTLHHAGYGVADRAAGTAVGPATLFEIGSIGKSFTAILLLRLADPRVVEAAAEFAGAFRSGSAGSTAG